MSTSTYVLNPYLTDARGKPAGEHLRKQLAERVGEEIAGQLAYVWDATTGKTKALDPSQLELLRGLASGGGRVTLEDPGLDKEAIEGLIRREVLLDEAFAYHRHTYRALDIETNRHCNYRCTFCPVSHSPKPIGFMTDEDFELVLDRVLEYRQLRFPNSKTLPHVSLHWYSEPTLDPRLVDRLRLVKEKELEVLMVSNASLLDAEKVAAIAELKVINHWSINLPSVDPEQFAKATGAKPKMLKRVLENIRSLREAGETVRLSINAPRDSDQAKADLEGIDALLEELIGPSILNAPESRAGEMTNPDYAELLHHQGLLGGCDYTLRAVQVNMQAQVSLCCNDFREQYILGDLHEQSVAEIAEGERAVSIRRQLFGLDLPEPDLICTRCASTCSRPEFPDWLAPQRGELPLAT
jgi:pyruvate-formate lyase-activating enzyme